MNTESLIGKQIEAYCNKCKNNTIHFITTVENGKIAKVMCDICKSYHKYRKPGSAASSAPKKSIGEKKVGKPRKRKKTKNILLTDRDEWESKIKKLDIQKAVFYDMQDNYENVDLIDHKTFGLGIIRNVLSNNKLEVLFKNGVKILVQNWKGE